MTSDLLLRNVAVYSAQIAAVVAATALAIGALRMHSPQARLLLWRIVLSGCLLLPVFAPWETPPDEPPGDVTATSTLISGGNGQDDAGWIRWPFTLSGSALLLAGIGVVLRFGMLGAGILRLRGIARRAEAVQPLTEPLRRAGLMAGCEVCFRWSDDVVSPVTFGFRAPVVLLPPDFAQLASAEQASVALHEAMHVQRRDWLYTLCEEVIRALLWFHPAIWFLLNRVQLAREQVVDRIVVECTQDADQYVGALLKIAASQIEPDLAPAPLFLRKRHLHDRVDAILKGVHMSKRRLVLTMSTLLTFVPVVAGLVAWYMPLRASAQTAAPDSAGVEVKTGYFKVRHRAPVAYPLSAREKGLEGAVVVSVTVDRNGEVVDARVLNSTGPEELRRAVLGSVLQWHFSMDAVEVAPGDRRPVPSTFDIAVAFHPDRAPAAPQESAAPPPQAEPLRTIARIDLSRVPADLRSKVEQALSVREGQSVSAGELKELQSAVRKVDSHLTMAALGAGPGRSQELSLSVSLRQPPVSMEAAVAPTGGMPMKIRVGGNVQANNLISKVTPIYPPLAKQARVQGVVQFQATIGRDGTVEELVLIGGHPLLVPSAHDAVSQWVYKPTLLNGNPVTVVTQIDVNYTLLE